VRPRSEQGLCSLPPSSVGSRGRAAVLGGVLFAAWGYIHRDGAPWYFTTVANMLAFIVPLLFLTALVGLYIRCGGRVGWLGGMGFAFGFIGSAYGIVDSLVDLPSWHLYVSSKYLLPLLLGWLPMLCLGLMMIGVTPLGRNAPGSLGACLFATGGLAGPTALLKRPPAVSSRRARPTFRSECYSAWAG
jgi:hypothetical protein